MEMANISAWNEKLKLVKKCLYYDVYSALNVIFGKMFVVQHMSDQIRDDPEKGGKYTCGAIIRKNVTHQTEYFYVVGQVTILSTACNMHLSAFNMYNNEARFYEKILPLYQDVVAEYEMQEIEYNASIFPTFYGSLIFSTSMPSLKEAIGLIVTEDLAVRQYYTIDAHIGLDLAHAKMAIKALAKFHVLGMLVVHKVNCTEIQFENNDVTDIDLATLLLPVRNNHSLRPHVMKLEPNMRVRFSNYIRNKNKTTSSLTSIVHGNVASSHSFRFHRDGGGKIDDAILVDLCNYSISSPFRDLSAFLCFCISTDLMRKDIKQLLDLYYKEFTKHVTKFNIDIGKFNREKFEDSLKLDTMFEFVHCSKGYDKGEERMIKIVRLFMLIGWIE